MHVYLYNAAEYGFVNLHKVLIKNSFIIERNCTRTVLL